MKTQKKSKEGRKKIQSAVIDLLKDHEFSELKVTAICQKAKINRSTFYDNYLDIFDLADQLREYLTQQFIELQKDIHEPNFLKLLENIKQNQDQYRIFFKMQLHVGLAEQIDDNFNQQNKYEKIFFRAGVEAVISNWLINNCQESPAEIAKIIEEYKK
ncbi:TetR-like C-terminal domain-containing protein [Xylocopilactobacillus apis]|uniref:TetR family transcriptional regulator n=1 Tax=Xylocopilactobacillus apis TaxID=2932183 RepID=A0AAU9CXA5_9LACO|nr:TetR-like C-terminal domain-containing protein [Xylocopilactobacillus apis]BDR56004.1 TetR family transcriptional regulator [Xylocopilactobacillus apis]